MTYTLEELACLFDVTERTLQNKLPQLAKKGFPPKLPGSKIWSRPQVDNWIATQAGKAPDPRQVVNKDSDDILENASAQLTRTYGGVL